MLIQNTVNNMQSFSFSNQRLSLHQLKKDQIRPTSLEIKPAKRKTILITSPLTVLLSKFFFFEANRFNLNRVDLNNATSTSNKCREQSERTGKFISL